ncbi:MAG TPA: MauE/DoxX family redox-associated membrane protein [Actinocrinis sp.]|uniref:MauE/DoxX family redox-associated membrane protein n=1 Tax=Actinocrinis sp. TaxID=1920516 RepID=UPI002DDDB3BF|nr:MauE/DoxX family redox-associated membrane protein [Actinocrinis sp.]HEV2343419.1 MauE/DoxX family redox-associated membrane protein [Actinocrinis sp.]
MHWLPEAALSGAVLGCGVLFVLAGTVKLGRTARRAPGRGGTAADAGAIRAALRIAPARWRWVELLAGLVETATGVTVCLGAHPAVAGSAMAAQGALFVSVLTYARRAKAQGGCNCVRKPKNSDTELGWPVQARAVFLLAAGAVQAIGIGARVQPWGSGAGVAVRATVVAIALGVLAVLLEVEQPWRTPRCRRRILSPRRDAFRALTNHGTFAAMSAAAGPFVGGHTHRRDGCADEFRFPATERVVVFRISRTGPGGAPAVEARIELGAEVHA